RCERSLRGRCDRMSACGHPRRAALWIPTVRDPGKCPTLPVGHKVVERTRRYPPESHPGPLPWSALHGRVADSVTSMQVSGSERYPRRPPRMYTGCGKICGIDRAPAETRRGADRVTAESSALTATWSRVRT